MATSLPSRGVGRPGLDEQSKAMLYEGLNLSQLGVAFRMDHRVLTEKLQTVKPSGMRNGAATWTIHEVAPHLIKPIYDIEAYIKRMHHADLPKHLTKEFWAGLRSKQEYELKAGDLWPTAKVVQEVGELMKLVKMSVLLMSDTVERSTELSDKQRQILKQLTDGMLQELHRAVIEKFTHIGDINGNTPIDAQDEDL